MLRFEDSAIFIYHGSTPIFAWFRQGMRCSYYIDYSYNLDQLRLGCQENTVLVVETLESLGLTINHQKSVLVPCQRLVFFGYIIDTVQFKVFLIDEKVQRILFKAQILLEYEIVWVRELASFIDVVVSSFYAIFEAPLHYMAL